MQFPQLHLPEESFGARGEEIACDFLKRNGYRICVRNFRTKIGELDIICTRVRTYYFVEVKTMKVGNDAYVPEMHFTHEKLQKMQRSALLYFKSVRMSPETAMQFDLIAVELSDDGAVSALRHYENL